MLTDSYTSQVLRKDLYEEKMREIANRRIELEKQIKEIKTGSVPEVTIEQIKNVFLDCNKAADSYLHATDEAKRRTLKNYFRTQSSQTKLWLRALPQSNSSLKIKSAYN